MIKKILLLSTIFFCGSTIFCSTIKELPLRTGRPITLFIGYKKTPLTVAFPSSIQGGLFAMNCMPTEEAAKIKNKKDRPGFVYNFKANSFFFNIWAQKEKARGSINVVFDKKVYVFHLVESSDNYYSSVTLVPESGSGSGSTQYRKTNRHMVVGIVEEAKTYQILKQRAGVVDDIEYFKPEPSLISEYNNFKIIIKEVFKYRRHDTLVFNTVFVNKTSQGISYNPQKVAAQIGSIRMPVTAIKSPGIIPPHSEYPVWFGIANTRLWTEGPPLSAKNKDWYIIVITDAMKAKSKVSTIANYIDRRSDDIFEKALTSEKISDLKKLSDESKKLEEEIKVIKQKYNIQSQTKPGGFK